MIAPAVQPRQNLRDDRWLALFAVTRLLATATAVLLLLVHPDRPHDNGFALVALAYGLGTVALATFSRRIRASRIAWTTDVVAGLLLVVLAGEWRSPFYLLALTSLILPSTTLSFARAVGVGFAFTGAYIAIASTTGLKITRLDSTARLDSLATHVLMPLIVAFSLAYASMLLRRLEDERERSETLAIETERRRIAWELHDSSKQRVHAAHLVLSQLPARLEQRDRQAVELALAELSNAATDMDASLWELRAPLQSERLEDMLRARAAELSSAGSTSIKVHGHAPPLPGWVATHVYRIASEALTNAVRHGAPKHIAIALAGDGNGFEISVADDGAGLSANGGVPSHGFESMKARAKAIEGQLVIDPGPSGRGTFVRLRIPVHPQNGAHE